MDLDEFEDDDLDALPDNTLEALEQRATTATQRDDRSVQRSKAQEQLPSSDYGFDDEDVIDLDEPSILLPPASGLPLRDRFVPAPAPRLRTKAPLDSETEAAFAAADAELGTGRSDARAGLPRVDVGSERQNGATTSALEQRVAEMESEHAVLRQSAKEARDALMAKHGEISIVRANHEKTAKEYERRLAAMQKLHAEQIAKQRAELDAGKKELEKMQTDNRFLQHDLRQDAERTKVLTGASKARSATAASRGRATPQKSKRFALGDGFDDEEVLRVSPSKSKDRSAENTPRLGAKRKRAAQDSPIPTLSFSQPPALLQSESSEIQAPFVPRGQDYPHATEDAKFDFMQRMLKHVSLPGQDPAIEELSRHFFPSRPTKSLSFMLTELITTAKFSSSETCFPLTVCEALLALWKRCLEEQHYAPFSLILDLLRFSLRRELSSAISQIIEEAVPLCIQTTELVAVPTARSVNPLLPKLVDTVTLEKFHAQIDVDAVMDFLRLSCESASLSDERIEVFWRTMEYESTLIMLHRAQPISQIVTALRMLSTSVRSTTFGPISLHPERQAIHERNLIGRLANALFGVPSAPSGEPPYLPEEIAELRIEVLRVFKSMCLTSHGGLLLAQHPTAIGRMILFVNKQVPALYATVPAAGQTLDLDLNDPNDPETSEPGLHDLIAECINTTVILLHHLLRTYEKSISFTTKTSAVKGGHHHFITAMTRIAFSEQLVLDASLSDQAVEAAHAILDEILNPEEGEAVMRAVETPRGSRSTAPFLVHTGETTERATESEEEEVDVDMLDAG